MFLHCLRCSTGLGHEAENLPHDAYMTDEGPLCGECVAVLLNAALPMYEALNEAAAHIESLIDNADDTGLRLYAADINALWSRSVQMRRAIARADGIGHPVEPGAEETRYEAGGESPAYRAHLRDAGRAR